MWNVSLVNTYSSAEPANQNVAITQKNHQMLVLVLGTGDGRDYSIGVATFNGQNMLRPAGFPVRYSADGLATVDLVYIDVSGWPTGTYTLHYEVTTGGPDGGGFAAFLIEGGNQFDLIEDSDANTGNGGNATTNLTTVQPNCLLVDVFFSDRNADLTLGTNQTQIFQIDPTGDSSTDRFGASYKVVASPGAQSMFWTGSSEEWAHGAIAINPARNGGAFILSML